MNYAGGKHGRPRFTQGKPSRRNPVTGKAQRAKTRQIIAYRTGQAQPWSLWPSSPRKTSNADYRMFVRGGHVFRWFPRRSGWF